MNAGKKKGLGRGLSALFGDSVPKEKLPSTNQNNVYTIQKFDDSRYLDPLRLSSQWSFGLKSWLEMQTNNSSIGKVLTGFKEGDFLKTWVDNDLIVESYLDKKLPLKGPVSETAIARWVPRLLPENLPIMLSASSPVRDSLTFSGGAFLSRRFFGFRGASGIDGTLSLAMGLSIQLGRTILITGDLALLHDSNGWLFANPSGPPLTVLLIDNGGGGIFHQLSLDKQIGADLELLFSMPQSIDPMALTSAYGINNRQISCLEDLSMAIEWSLAQAGPSLLRVCTDPVTDVTIRSEIRNWVANNL